MQRRALLAALTGGFLSSVLASGCQRQAPKVFRVGATAGPHAAIVAEAAKVAKKAGLDVKLVEFTDYLGPDKALAEKELDANVYQHEPFLQNFNRQNKTTLQAVAKAVVQPMGFYSDRIRSLDAIPEGATVTIPNDPSNSGRALLLLQAAGLVRLKNGNATDALASGNLENLRGLKIRELEAAQLPRSLGDADFAVIPMNYVISSGLSPEKQGFYFESLQAPFALMVIAARKDNARSEAVQQFIRAYQSPEVKEFILKTFKGTVNPAW